MNEQIKKSFVAFKRANTTLEKKMVDVLLNYVDNTKALRLNVNCYFYNNTFKEHELIHYITTDGNSIYLCSGNEKDVFFKMREFGGADLIPIFDAIENGNFNIEEVFWKPF